MLEATRKHTDLNLAQFDDFTVDYARTLHAWRQRFLEKRWSDSNTWLL